jgi:hypothetical protein
MASFFPRAASLALRSSARPALRVQRPAAPLFRRGFALPAEQPRLRLGSIGMWFLERIPSQEVNHTDHA